jgi:hypothetical protein
VEGRLLDSLQAPVPFIPVALCLAADSSIVKGSNTNAEGKYSFDGLKAGTYFIKIDNFGYASFSSQSFTLDSLAHLDLGTFILKATAVNLNEVAIVTQKKLIEFKNGNIVVNVENSPLAVGNSLYELLLRLPTVTIVDDVISIQGKDGARVMIDERLQQQSGAQLMNLLRSIQASNIEKIEILKNPPPKYDAAGAGFISVKTKKLKITGFSGSVGSNYTQGFYANKGLSFALNYKGKNFAVFSNFSGGNDAMHYTSLFNKRITYDGVTTNFNQITTEKNANLYGNFTVGADWYVNKRNTVGFRIEGNKGEARPVRHGVNNLSDGSLGYNQLQFGSVRPNAWKYINYNLNAEHQFDTLGTLIRVSADYSPNLDLNSGDFQNYFLNTQAEPTLPARIFKSDNNLKFVIFTGKVDFEKALTKTLKLEAGAKGNNQDMLTKFNFLNQNQTTGDYTTDTTYTNGFEYKEKIYAGYFNLMKEYKKFNFNGGLRGENTSIRAASTTSNVAFKRDYFNLFPTASISYDPSPKHSFQVAYDRRIDRPSYTSFNPYKYFVNLFVSFQGNPYLLPQYTQNMEFTHGYKSSFYNTISYSVHKNIFYGYPIQNDSTKETLQKTSNLQHATNLSYSTYLQKDLTKWWMLTFNGWASYIMGKGTIDGKPYSLKSIQAAVFVTNQLTLPKAIKAEVSARYFIPTHVVIYDQIQRWALDLALRKSFFKNKLNATIGVNDVFFTWIQGNTVNYLNINSDLRTTFDTRRFKVNLSYNFGKVKVQQRQVKSNQEEKARLEH